MSESWEWREGRLLAYELILKFLITNHIHYVFPTFVLPVSKTSASSSADETLMSRYVNLHVILLCKHQNWFHFFFSENKKRKEKKTIN